MDDFVAITPVNFFQLNFDCHYLPTGFPRLGSGNIKKYTVPSTSDLCSEPSFAHLAFGWNKEGLEFYIQVNQPARKSNVSEITKGDSVELFIDTRDVKSAGFNTRFCHHFFFLPEMAEGQGAKEKTHFRTEDRHELCDPKDLKVKALLKHNAYVLQIFIPSQCLYGYDPEQFDRLGFTYRINRPNGPSQHFSVVSEDYQVDQQPSLWSSVKLVQENSSSR